MSVAKLLLSGVLVASGLILGAFTLHAAFAPAWDVQASAAARRDARPQPPAEVFQEADRIAATDVPDNWAPRLIKTPDPKLPVMTDADKAKKKPAEKNDKNDKKKKAKQEEPQTVFSWLAGLLNKSQ
jgi:hypothetical protein